MLRTRKDLSTYRAGIDVVYSKTKTKRSNTKNDRFIDPASEELNSHVTAEGNAHHVYHVTEYSISTSKLPSPLNGIQLQRGEDEEVMFAERHLDFD